jgi:SAM-dependent methyltransferase
MPRPQFPLTQSHLDLAFSYWKQLVSIGDQVIDATCGNGNDSLRLARLSLNHHSGSLYCIDIQKAAIAQTQALLQTNLSSEEYQRVCFLEQSHDHFPIEIKQESVTLIVYNLGYLPRSDKQLTTKVSSTLESLKNAKDLIKPGGVISVTCYPGHPEGALEQKAILQLTNDLKPHIWNCCHHTWINRQHSPSLLILQKAI